MSEAEQMTAVARQRAEKRIDKAIGELRVAALKIGEENGIPEGIQGHSIEELLGRVTYVPSMARELRRVCGQEMAKAELNDVLTNAASKEAPKRDTPTTGKIEPSKIPAQVPVNLDVGQLDGVSVQTVNALREAGLHKVGEIVVIPDEHLVKLQGLGEKSVAHLRAAIAKASQ